MRPGKDAGTGEFVPLDDPSGHGHQQCPGQVGGLIGDAASRKLRIDVPPDHRDSEFRRGLNVDSGGTPRHGGDQLQLRVCADDVGVDLIAETAQEIVLPGNPREKGVLGNRLNHIRMNLNLQVGQQLFQGRFLDRLGNKNLRLQHLSSLIIRFTPSVAHFASHDQFRSKSTDRMRGAARIRAG